MTRAAWPSGPGAHEWHRVALPVPSDPRLVITRCGAIVCVGAWAHPFSGPPPRSVLCRECWS